MQTHFLVLQNKVTTKSAARGTWCAVLVEPNGDRSTVANNVSQDAAYQAAQAKATSLGLAKTLIAK